MKHYTRNSDGKYVGVVYRYYVKSDCKESGFSYVGTTTNETIRKQCWNKPNNPYAGGKIAEARKKLGLSSFEYEALESIDSENIEELKSLLKEKETEYIKKFDSTVKGYNCSKGGTGNTGVEYDESRRKACGNAMRGKHHTPETIAKIKESLKGRKQTPITKEKIRQAKLGKPFTEEHKKHMSEVRKGKVPEKACAAAKKWAQENGGSFWKGKTMSEAARANMKLAQQKRAIPVTAIFPDGSQKSYPSMLDAAKDNKLNAGSVYNSVKHNGKTKNGIKFRNYEKEK